MALFLFCGTALAKVEVNAVDSAVKVAQKSANEAIFTVTKDSGAEAGQLYLIMIQQGDDASAAPKPTKENLYYLNVEAAEGASVSMEAYPKDMSDGSYVVYLSDYANGGAAKGVATLVVSSGGETPVGGVKGDLDNDEKRTVDDVMTLIKIVVNNEDQSAFLSAADFDGDKLLTIDDVMTLIKMVVNNE